MPDVYGLWHHLVRFVVSYFQYYFLVDFDSFVLVFFAFAHLFVSLFVGFGFTINFLVFCLRIFIITVQDVCCTFKRQMYENIEHPQTPDTF